jgi:phage tail sheath protein FI
VVAAADPPAVAVVEEAEEDVDSRMPRPIEAVGTSTAAFVGLAPKGPVKKAVKLTHSAEFARVFGGLNSSMPLGHVVQHFFDNGGKEAHVVRVDLERDAIIGTEKRGTGIYALDKVDLFNILVVPDKEVDVTAQAAAIAYCERRRAFMIIDAPETVTTVGAAEAWIGSLPPALRSSNAAFYFPRVRAPDPSMNGAVRSFPAAGAVAGVYARTDIARGVWKAPAGAEAKLMGVAGLTLELDDRDNARLNPLGLNCLRTFPIHGTVSWGARTARGSNSLADEFKYVPVRRLALFLEESILRGTQWAASEMNNEALWTEMRDSIAAFMHSLFRQGAFAGIKSNEAFFVKCDASTTTQTDIDSGRVNIEIGFAPLKRSEFIILRIQQIAGGNA